MAKITKEIVLAELGKIKSAGNDNDVITSGAVSSVIVHDDNVGFVVNIADGADKIEMEGLRKLCEDAVYNIEGVVKVTAVMTNDHDFRGENNLLKEMDEDEHKKEGDGQLAIGNRKGTVKPPSPKNIPGIKKIIAVASGKGGVGKSTIAAHLALAYAAKGEKIGLVDADILGPSIARMMNLKGEPVVENNKMIPPESNGVKCMSMGMLLGENAPAIWRGPMVTKALHQLMLACEWGELDVLVMDLPPGTGDIQLSLLQNYKVDGVVLVSTPQEVALMDVKKAASMFRKLNIDIIGVLENMSYFEDSTGKKVELFGAGHVEKYCQESGMRFLGKVPVMSEISESCDRGIEVKGNKLIEILNAIIS